MWFGGMLNLELDENIKNLSGGDCACIMWIRLNKYVLCGHVLSVICNLTLPFEVYANVVALPRVITLLICYVKKIW